MASPSRKPIFTSLSRSIPLSRLTITIRTSRANNTFCRETNQTTAVGTSLTVNYLSNPIAKTKKAAVNNSGPVSPRNRSTQVYPQTPPIRPKSWPLNAQCRRRLSPSRPQFCKLAHLRRSQIRWVVWSKSPCWLSSTHRLSRRKQYKLRQMMKMA